MADTFIDRDVMRIMTEKRQELDAVGVEQGPLFDTVEGMLSLDYKERFKAEYRQTKIRYEKLKDFCNQIEAAEIMGKKLPNHDCPFYMLKDQKRTMGDYLHILELRALIEEIELEV